MKNPTKLIAITGGSGAGKTWLANYLQGTLGAANAACLSLDSFYLDRSAVPPSARAEINYDHPDSIDWPGFERVLGECRCGQPVLVPAYDFASHTRLPFYGTFIPAGLVLVEGLWLLQQPQISELFDVKIYLDCPSHLRLERRLARDVAERNRSPESVRTQFWKTVAPMHDQFVAPQAKWADLILQEPLYETEISGLVEILEIELHSALTPVTAWSTDAEFQSA